MLSFSWDLLIVYDLLLLYLQYKIMAFYTLYIFETHILVLIYVKQ